MTFANIFTVIIVLSLSGTILTAPAREYDDPNIQIHDQRQNGTENYRLDFKDVLIVFSPVDTMFSVAGLAGLAGSESGFLKPPPVEQTETNSLNSHLTFLADLKHLDNNSPEIEDSTYEEPPVHKPSKKW